MNENAKVRAERFCGMNTPVGWFREEHEAPGGEPRCCKLVDRLTTEFQAAEAAGREDERKIATAAAFRRAAKWCDAESDKALAEAKSAHGKKQDLEAMEWIGRGKAFHDIISQFERWAESPDA